MAILVILIATIIGFIVVGEIVYGLTENIGLAFAGAGLLMALACLIAGAFYPGAENLSYLYGMAGFYGAVAM
jgi:hypothetical protein